MDKEKPMGPITVSWAYVVAVSEYGIGQIIDYDFVHEVKAKRLATLDDIYAACAITKQTMFVRPSTDTYALAFLVFQVPEGYIAASPDIFENIIPVTSPGDAQIEGSLHVLQAQIIAHKTADIVAPLAAQATLSVLKGMAMQEAKDPDAASRTPGGLIRA